MKKKSIFILVVVFLSLIGCAKALDNTINEVEVVPPIPLIFYVTSYRTDGTVITKTYDSMSRSESGCYIGYNKDGGKDYYPIQSTWIEEREKK